MTVSYTTAHSSPQGVGDSRPTAVQIIKDEGLEGKMKDKVIVVTGTSSGIGLETARALSLTGATLFLTARNLPAAEKALKGILEPGRVSLIAMDNKSLGSVRAAAREIVTESKGKVNILIANAGVMGIQQRELTEDGHETHFQTNFLSHFLLCQLLKDALIAAATPAFQSRVVIVSSSAHRAAKQLPESNNYSAENGQYDSNVAYAVSNLEKIYLANEMNRRYSAKGVFANSLHPGAIYTNIGRHMDPKIIERFFLDPYISSFLKSPEQGAATTVLAAVGAEWEGKGGKYLEDCAEAKRGEDDGQVFGVGWVKQTYDPKAEGRLWDDAVKMLALENGA